MKVLVDTNVILDVLCERERFLADSLQVFQSCETRRIEGYLSALSIPNIVYIMRKELDGEKIREILRTLTLIFNVVELREADLLKAADLAFGDYEDALQTVCAMRVGADYIVTRNGTDFAGSAIPAITPTELLLHIG